MAEEKASTQKVVLLTGVTHVPAAPVAVRVTYEPGDTAELTEAELAALPPGTYVGQEEDLEEAAAKEAEAAEARATALASAKEAEEKAAAKPAPARPAAPKPPAK